MCIRDSPYTKRYLGTFANHFSTLGLIGMNEVALNAKWLGMDLTQKEAEVAAERGKTLETHIPPGVHVRSEEKLFGQILGILLDNAVNCLLYTSNPPA